MPSVLFCFDKFRGTASARELGDAGGVVADDLEWSWRSIPLADGGEGSIDALGGPNRWSRVSGPLGDALDAGWRMDGPVAFLEMAAASGLMLVGGRRGNDPIDASTAGTGQLIRAALDEGAERVIVFLGGSATTDGGINAVREIADHPRLGDVELVAAADVTTCFVEAAAVFAPQKGATPEQVVFLRERLEATAEYYRATHGVDVCDRPGTGAAGGLAGGIVALGGRLASGFDVLASAIGLSEAVADSDLVVTGEGMLDRQSFSGKVIGGVLGASRPFGVAVLAIVGDCEPGVEVPPGLEFVSLTERFGVTAALADPLALVQTVIRESLLRADESA